MSTGADCALEEREPGRWWYRIQQYPYGETEEYAEHGPFSSASAAERDLRSRYANPGGWDEVDHAEWSRRTAARERREAEAREARAAREAARSRVPLRRWSR